MIYVPRRNSEYENIEQNFRWSCLSRLDVRIDHQGFENRKFDFCSIHIFWWVRYRLVKEPNRTLDLVGFVYFFFVSSISFYDRTKSNLIERLSSKTERSGRCEGLLWRGVPTLKISVSWERQTLFGNMKVMAGNREPREIIRETANNIGILHNIFGVCI